MTSLSTWQKIVLVCAVCVSAGFAQSPTILNSDSLFAAAIRSERAGDYAPARRMLRTLLNVYPAYHDARVAYGRLLGWNSQYQAALVQLDSVLVALPSSPDARFVKAQVLGWSGKYRQSADMLLVLVDETPPSILYRVELAKVYSWGGSPRRALEQYEQAYLQNPNAVDVLRGLARTHRQLRSYDLCRHWYEKLLARLPTDGEAQLELLRLTYQSTVELQLQASFESFSSPDVSGHSIGQAELYLTPHEDWKPFVHYSRVSKFSKKENRFGAGAYVTLGYDLSLLAQGILAPGATVAPRVDALAELTASVGEGFDLIGGYRFVKFNSATVHIAVPGVTYFVSNDLWITARSYVGFVATGSTTNSLTATLSYIPAKLTTVKVGAFSGTEAFRATTLSELSSLKTSGALISAKSRMTTFLALEGLYQYTSRSTPGNSHLVLVTLSFLM